VPRAWPGAPGSARSPRPLPIEPNHIRYGVKLYRQVIKQAGPTLIKLLELEQPNNHDFVYSILKQVSGKDLGERDIAAWQRWLAEQHSYESAGHSSGRGCVTYHLEVVLLCRDAFT
jgi:hypothetical protein